MQFQHQKNGQHSRLTICLSKTSNVSTWTALIIFTFCTLLEQRVLQRVLSEIKAEPQWPWNGLWTISWESTLETCTLPQVISDGSWDTALQFTGHCWEALLPFCMRANQPFPTPALSGRSSKSIRSTAFIPVQQAWEPSEDRTTTETGWESTTWRVFITYQWQAKDATSQHTNGSEPTQAFS